MTSVITGDIVNSRGVSDPQKWLKPLKKLLADRVEDELKWEIFRGDSFQAEITDPAKAFEMIVLIKSTIKMIKGLDVRMALGIGVKEGEPVNIAEARGEVYLHSGALFESLKQEKLSIALKSNDPEMDEELNLMFQLGCIAMDNWTPNSAEIVRLSILNPTLSQTELGMLIGIRQNTVSERQKRAYLDEVLAIRDHYKKRIDHFIDKN
ncbi:SatD family protein [Robertkochia solimangrovi]|uniref:SatD family protein n=1 Tax=Robertkochia solimangrovi TaxID=2213046 RepID=UPI00117F9A07|nr:SatD family protein [Robertkochia solimangrovi]TRZ43667.1 transcriptional regulator [Robertkochia solimangrovi]